jgi:hypothetical protein
VTLPNRHFTQSKLLILRFHLVSRVARVCRSLLHAKGKKRATPEKQQSGTIEFWQFPRSTRSACSFSWPWLREIEINVSADALEVTLVIGDEQATGFTARQRQQDVIRERLRNATDLQAFRPRHVRQQVARTVPRIGGRRNRASGSLEDGEDVPFERSSIVAPFHSGPQFLGHDDAEMLEWRERPMEALE